MMLIEQWTSAQESNSPVLSVCMPVYNGMAFLERAFACIASQTLKNFEVIIIDDGSQDDSAAKSRELMTRYGLYGEVLRSTNQGAEQSRDTACTFCSTNIIAPFDCDDHWESTYLEEMYAALMAHPETGLVYCDIVEEFTHTGRTAVKSEAATWVDLTAAADRIGDVYRFSAGDFFPLLLRGQVLFPPCTMFKRETYDRAKGYAQTLSDLRVSLDWGFGLRASRVGGVAFLKKPLLRKYVHGGNVSGNTLYTLSCSIRVLESLLEDRSVEGSARQFAKEGLARRCREAAYEQWSTYKRRWEAFRLCLKSLRYELSKRAVMMAFLAMLPFPLVDLARRIRNRGTEAQAC